MQAALQSEAPPVATQQAARRPIRPLHRLGALLRGAGSAAEWTFGVLSLLIALAVLAAIPIAQFLSFGYFLESSARVARSGRLRDGVIGVRRAARLGSAVLGTGLVLLPVLILRSYAETGRWIEPLGPHTRTARAALAIVGALLILHVLVAWARGGRLRHFAWPVGNALWLLKRLRRPQSFYIDTRDAFCSAASALRLPRYFRLGLLGSIGTVLWLALPAALIAAGGKVPPLGFLGALLLAFVVPVLPFLQVGFAVEDRFAALFDRKNITARFKRAPWAFSFALGVLLLAAIPLYLLKIEFIPREAAWLPSLAFVAFLAPARPLIGWAYARSAKREQPRHWCFRVLGRLAIVPVALVYVLIVFLSQYTSWAGAASLFQQHAFLIPVPF